MQALNRAQFGQYNALGNPAYYGLDAASLRVLDVPAVPFSPLPPMPPEQNPRGTAPPPQFDRLT